METFPQWYWMQLVFDFHRVGRVGVFVPSACSVSSRHNDQPQELQVVRAEPTSSQIPQAFHRSVLDPEQPGNYYFSLYVTGMWNSKSITKVRDLGYCSGAVTTIIMSSLYVIVATLWCCVFETHDPGQWLHGFHPVEAQQSVQDMHKQSPLSQIFPWAYSHPKHPCLSEQLCLLLHPLLHISIVFDCFS